VSKRAASCGDSCISPDQHLIPFDCCLRLVTLQLAISAAAHHGRAPAF
jgi:hypothetical protein